MGFFIYARSTSKLVWGGTEIALLHIELFYCNLEVILYQKIIDLLCLGAWSQSLLTQKFPCCVGVDVCFSKLWYFDTK